VGIIDLIVNTHAVLCQGGKGKKTGDQTEGPFHTGIVFVKVEFVFRFV